MQFDGEHTLIIKDKILSRAQPFREAISLIYTNVFVCIALLVLVLFPGACGDVWGEF